MQCVEALARRATWSLLFPPPDDDHAGGVGRRQQTLVAVEADVQHRAAVALQLVYDGLGVALHSDVSDFYITNSLTITVLD